VLAPSHPVLCSPRLRRQRWSPALGVRSAPRGGDVPRRSCKPSRRAADSDKARSRTKQGRRARGRQHDWWSPWRTTGAETARRCAAAKPSRTCARHHRPRTARVRGRCTARKTTGCALATSYSAQRCRQRRGRLRLVRAGSYCRRPRTAPPSGCAAPPRGGGRTGKPNANK
jgi:hypothetical protein